MIKKFLVLVFFLSLAGLATAEMTAPAPDACVSAGGQGCGGSQPADGNQSTMPRAPFISPDEVRAWQAAQKPVTLVDVRETSEFDAGHIPGAINIPYAEVENRLNEFNYEMPYVIYCIHSAWRAPYIANLLADHGHQNVYILEGGIAAWNAQGQELSTTNGSGPGVVAPYPKDLKKELKTPAPGRDYRTKINLTEKQLAEFDGLNGRPAYVAVNGVIYDLTQSRLWRGGEHYPSHHKAYAGRDVTALLEDSPHGDKHLKSFPVVGRLVKRKE